MKLTYAPSPAPRPTGEAVLLWFVKFLQDCSEVPLWVGVALACWWFGHRWWTAVIIALVGWVLYTYLVLTPIAFVLLTMASKRSQRPRS